MSSWHPNDLVTDQDLVDYESKILTKFGVAAWAGKRTKALEDWLFPILRANGFDPQRLRTRFDADQVWQYTAAAYSPLTGQSLPFPTIFATPASDALFVGSVEPFRGIFFRLLDAVSAVASVMTVRYWAGTWKALSIADGTIVAPGVTLSAGGSVSWAVPCDWAPRVVNNSASLYFIKATISATPTAGTLATGLGLIRASALRAPVVFRTLELIMREAPTGGDGPWEEKATYYHHEAAEALERALPLIGGEFDTDQNDQIGAAEATQTEEQAGGGWRLERR